MRSFDDFSTVRSLRQRNFRLLVEGKVISTSRDFMQGMAQSGSYGREPHGAGPERQFLERRLAELA